MDSQTLDHFLLAIQQSPQVLIITAGRGGGKTSTLRKIVASIEEKGILDQFSGFLAVSEGVEKKKYFAQSIDGTYKILLMQSDPDYTGPNRVCTYNFHPEAFVQVQEKLKLSCEQGVRCLIIDEVARLEVADQGWSSLIQYAQLKQISLIITIRSKYLQRVCDKFNFKQDYILSL